MDIVLFSTDCPRCKVLKSKLNAKNIKYTENNDTDEMIRLGITMVPVLKVDGVMKNFAEANQWVNEQE